MVWFQNCSSSFLETNIAKSHKCSPNQLSVFQLLSHKWERQLSYNWESNYLFKNPVYFRLHIRELQLFLERTYFKLTSKIFSIESSRIPLHVSLILELEGYSIPLKLQLFFYLFFFYSSDWSWMKVCAEKP